MFTKRLNVFLMALLLLAALGCSKSDPQTLPQAAKTDAAKGGTVEQILQRGVLRVGFSTFVPWAMQDKKGEFIGYEIDVARRLAQDMGVSVQFEPTQWSGIIPALLSGKFDIIIGGMSIQPQRAMKVNFTIPYEYSGMSIVADKLKAGKFKSLADFDRPDVILAIRQGTTAVDAAKKYLPKAQLRLFDQEAQTIQEVLSGRAHAVVASDPFPAFQALKYPDKLVLPLAEPFTKEPIAFAVRKGDPDFVNFLDGWIRMANDEGWLTERHNYWFRTDKWKDQVE
ncbi:MAG TPA: transporter substrate-binding domain-containing protein [Humidesulfovibrio sp.]|uniref:transporter substrate-binding domain-containing protein n=1 Tax=Humidesulfovibrio sp. TaxID=2910988 RepID=UPI002B7B970D|nr:transporter substrate-binding domain-containing protein [Humidesulfovibrio sp.]HWR04070.1 transporter substrate-binding domain-containing protein [Humidesulfovibrio sp.]